VFSPYAKQTGQNETLRTRDKEEAKRIAEFGSSDMLGLK
jgi:hypothetical protein